MSRITGAFSLSDSITRSVAGCFRFFTSIQCFETWAVFS